MRRKEEAFGCVADLLVIFLRIHERLADRVLFFFPNRQVTLRRMRSTLRKEQPHLLLMPDPRSPEWANTFNNFLSIVQYLCAIGGISSKHSERSTTPPRPIERAHCLSACVLVLEDNRTL